MDPEAFLLHHLTDLLDLGVRRGAKPGTPLRFSRRHLLMQELVMRIPPKYTSTHTTGDGRPIPQPKGIEVFGQRVHAGHPSPLATEQPCEAGCCPGSCLLHGRQVPGPRAR
jgi:hypothetical protein